MNPDYKDSGEYIEEILKDSKLKEKLYQDAVTEFASYHYRKALDYFKWIEEYKDSNDHIVKIKEFLEPKPIEKVVNKDTTFNKYKCRIIGSSISVVSFIVFVILGMFMPIDANDLFKSNVPTVSELPKVIIFTIVAFICFLGMIVTAIIANEKKVKHAFQVFFVLYVISLIVGLITSSSGYDDGSGITMYYGVLALALIIPAIAMYYGVYNESDTKLDEWPTLIKYKNLETKEEKQKRIQSEEFIKLKKKIGKILPIISGILILIGIVLFIIFMDSSKSLLSKLLILLPIGYMLFCTCYHISDGFLNGFYDDVQGVTGLIIGVGVALPFSYMSIPASGIISLSSAIPFVGLLFIGIPVAILLYVIAASIAFIPAVIWLICFVFMSLFSPVKFFKKNINTISRYIINIISFIVLISLIIIGALI